TTDRLRERPPPHTNYADTSRITRVQDSGSRPVNAPDRGTRHTRGKSDPIDAYAAARAAASGRATAIPKSHTGTVEALRQLRVARASAIKARTQAINQLIGLRVTAPEPLRASLTGINRTTLVNRCLRLRPGADLTCPTEAARYALRQLARRIRMLTEEIDEVTERLTMLTTSAGPELVALFGVGTETAGQLLVTAGDNPERLRTESAFAALCGAAPVPASSGRTDRHRLSRGGDRQANRALHMIAVVRMRYCPALAPTLRAAPSRDSPRRTSSVASNAS
ncbi:transposase, partial [Streptomyces sp. NPDC007117]|uniref:transposase n=1 Tax=Streptomyces sp. NPDC007117 TaxID=3154314 RepID=UPI0033EDDC84